MADYVQAHQVERLHLYWPICAPSWRGPAAIRRAKGTKSKQYTPRPRHGLKNNSQERNTKYDGLQGVTKQV